MKKENRDMLVGVVFYIVVCIVAVLLALYLVFSPASIWGPSPTATKQHAANKSRPLSGAYV